MPEKPDSMPDSREETAPGDPPPSRWTGWFHGNLPLETETAVFILVNVIDVFLTVGLVYHLRTHGEGNPLARYFLEHWGFQGLAYYKMSLVAFVCLITQYIARSRLTLARRLLYGLILIVGSVDLYSAVLLVKNLYG
jgi:hypothetical protein